MPVLDAHTLRGRLALGLGLALVIALFAFAAVALGVVDRAQRLALDAQLATTGRAAAAVRDPNSNVIDLDEVDRSQFGSIVGAKANGAIFRSDGSLAISSTYAIPPAIRELALRSTGEAYATLRVHGEDLRVFTASVALRGRRIGGIAVWRDADTIDALDRSVALAFAFAIPVMAVLAALAGGAIVLRALAPLERVVTVASEIEGHDLAQRIGLPARSDEVGRLAATFDRMLDRLQRAFDRERRFTSDASHELRAPLAVIRAEADLALRKERAPAEYRRALETIASEADALEALTHDLLTAARADAAPVRAEAVDLGGVARDAAERLSVLAGQRGIRLTLSIEDDAAVYGDPGGLERAVITVLHNAIKYARDGGTVELHAARDGDAIELRVADDGRGFSADALEHAFDRFWRDDEARSVPGSGLGLAIAKTIVERWHGTISIANGNGAVVRLRFPAQPPGGASSS